jgi:hypothetical protein
MRSAASWLLVSLMSVGAFAGDMEVSNIEHKLIHDVDQDGDVLVSIKASVKNPTENDQDVELWVQGIDGDGFEVAEVRLAGHVKSKETRVLTDAVYIREDVYKTVVKWVLEE